MCRLCEVKVRTDGICISLTDVLLSHQTEYLGQLKAGEVGKLPPSAFTVLYDIMSRWKPDEDLVDITLCLAEKAKLVPPVGTPISMSEATRRYKISIVSIWRWVKQGHFLVLQEPVAGGAEKLLDEHYIALFALAYHAGKGKSGSHLAKKIFAKLKIETPHTN